MKIQRMRTLLDTIVSPEPYRDHPWQPRGTKCHNGYRKHEMKGFRL